MEQPFADIFDWMFKLDCISSVDRKILNEGIIDKIKNLFRMNSNDKEEEDIVSHPLSYGTPDGFSCPALRLKGGYKNTNAYPFFYYGESKMGWIGTNGKCHTGSIADMPKRKDADAWLEKLAAKKGVKSKVCMWKKMRSRWADAELVDGRIWMFETPVMLVWNVKNAQWMIDAAERLARGIGFNKSDLLIGYGKRLYPYKSCKGTPPFRMERNCNSLLLS